MARRAERRLAVDVRFALAFLFEHHAAEIIPNEGVPFPPGFDYAFVTVRAENFLLRFTRGQGELGVHIAPAFAPSDWHDLSLVLAALGGRTLERQLYRDVWHVTRSLQPFVQQLVQTCAPEQFRQLRRQLDMDFYVHEQLALRQLEVEINASLYGPENIPADRLNHIRKL
jgi:hypothetical protein